jgi:hypothetical protein
MLDVIGRLLAASADTDAEVSRELEGFPEGYVIGFSLLGDSLAMRVQVVERRFVRLAPTSRADLDIVFKHLSHAFAVFSFQESTAQAFANDRALTQGDIALAMRFVRCLNRMQAVTLPSPIARKALKAPLPELAMTERALLTTKAYAHVVGGLLRRTNP